MSNSIRKDIAKEAAGRSALQFVHDGMRIGLGTGTTAAHFIRCLAEQCKQGLRIEAVATSEASLKLAKEGGIPLIDINSINALDLTVDGADEIDSKMWLIKGGGGAALREKIVANMSHEFLVIADESKRVTSLGKHPLAVEVLPFGYKSTLNQLEVMGYSVTLRVSKTGHIFISDNGNYIIDISLSYPCSSPEKDETQIKKVPGVLETGFFIDFATSVIIGFEDGHTELFNCE